VVAPRIRNILRATTPVFSVGPRAVRMGFRRRSYVRGNESSGTGITRHRQRTHADPQSVVGEFASIFTILSREKQSYLIEITCTASRSMSRAISTSPTRRTADPLARGSAPRHGAGAAAPAQHGLGRCARTDTVSRRRQHAVPDAAKHRGDTPVGE